MQKSLTVILLTFIIFSLANTHSQTTADGEHEHEAKEEEMKLLIFTKHCYENYFLKMDFGDVPCFKIVANVFLYLYL